MRLYRQQFPIFGSEADNPPYERHEMIAFLNYLRKRKIGLLAFHPRNEGKRTGRQAAIESIEGLVKGAVDIILPSKIPFVCEMKRRSNEWVLTSEQETYLFTAQGYGAFACIALGNDGAQLALKHWARISGVDVDEPAQPKSV